MDNFIRVDCDFCAAGSLWTRAGEGVTAESLKLSPALCVALRAWQAHYEELFWQVERKDCRFDFTLHESIGRQIADLVRTERPDLHVVFQGDEPYPGEHIHG